MSDKELSFCCGARLLGGTQCETCGADGLHIEECVDCEGEGTIPVDELDSDGNLMRGVGSRICTACNGKGTV